ncbi:TonB-dependent receptor [Sphingobacterium spiritivorum]|uniref:TonB-dependent receptor n=1 Tax=Sphingobacterium spiritivorum TaxID=258 RepID=UPI003DA1E472
MQHNYPILNLFPNIPCKKICSAVLFAHMICGSALYAAGNPNSGLRTIHLQQHELTGQILSEDIPLAGATVKIPSLSKNAITDENGKFRFKNLPSGKYKIIVSAIGHSRWTEEIQIGQNNQTLPAISLTRSTEQIEEVMVLGRTKVEEVNKQAYNVTALDATKLHNTTLDIGHALDRVSGVRVRETGGVGSDMNLSINGYSGKQIKIFIDGIPMEGFGSSFQLNNIPINLAERVEVYRGVVPVWLGADAMGGAINIVTGSSKKNYVDASYSYGSFNTHRTTINAGLTSKSGYTLQLNAYQNYSDNNYRISVPDGPQNVKRFHDTYHNEAIILQTGVVDKRYADRLLVGIQLGKSYKEMQTGARIESVFGSWYRKGDIITPTLRYQKRDLFIKGLTASVNANINLGHEQNIDTTYVRYDWYGTPKYYSGLGGEQSRSLYKYRNNTGLAAATFSYDINERNAIVLNNTYSTFNRKGSDELYPENIAYDLPRKSSKNITGLAYRYNHDGKWNVTGFFKNYFQRLKYSSSYNPSGNYGDVAYNHQQTNYNKIGYGIAGTYFLSPSLQLKASFENAKRMPEAEEVFGDEILKASNLDLKPESSDNYNLGVNYMFSINQDHRFAVDLGLLYRDSKDFIREKFNINMVKTIMENRASVTNKGIDAEIRYSYKKIFTAGANMSYHDFRNKTKYENDNANVSIVYNDRMPNIPYLYGNFDATVFLSDLGKKGNNLSIGYNLLYVHSMYLYWPSQGSEKLDIDTQFGHDINAVYSFNNGRYNIGLECKNITNAQLFDNFRLPKPSRGFFLKARYFISN